MPRVKNRICRSNDSVALAGLGDIFGNVTQGGADFVSRALGYRLAAPLALREWHVSVDAGLPSYLIFGASIVVPFW